MIKLMYDQTQEGQITCKNQSTIEPRNSGKFCRPYFFCYCVFFAILQVQLLKSEDLVIPKLSANIGLRFTINIAAFYYA